MTIGHPATAPVGALFADTDSPVRGAALTAFKSEGFSGLARYLSRTIGQNPGDLSPTEAQAILGAGLAIVPVQHVRPAGWTPTAALGVEAGMAAARNAASVGCPAGVCVWLDLESVSADADPADVIGYCEAWFSQVSAAMFVPGLYVGVSPGLDADQLYERLSVRHYWHAGSSSAPIPAVRGVQIVQTIADKSLNGVGYDSNVVRADALGGLPTWWTS